MLGRKRTYEEACEDQKAAEETIRINDNNINEVFSKNLLQIYYGMCVLLLLCECKKIKKYIYIMCGV